MQKKIFLLTNDNVFYLLLKSYIESTSSFVVCEKITNHNNLKQQNGNEAALIIIDGKMTDISPISLTYSIRYESHITTPIWLFSEINTQSYKKKALEVGVNKILEKPFDPIEIARNIVLVVL